ncbi:hypothetical protein [Streptomyces aurantiacus]|uniref:hypothetical protein n=1 Tax=Streptomyces aurantiacus TaxID=47760 RepID=UPI0006E445B6|nr:hypothetical protein [Streptomyces aurantiacus]
MLDLTLRLLAKVLNVCTPRPRGRHRLGALPPLRFTPVPPPRFGSLRGGLVPEHRRQRERRRAPYLATVGVDVGPDRIPGVPVTAR